MNQFVEINGNKISVYCYGKGAVTLVLLSGSGVAFPSLEYMSLAKELAKTYQVIGIEKLGYGYSDLAKQKRDIDTIIQEYRWVLEKLGIKTPVILGAHSMGFLEAVRWGQKYPLEVAGILGIDPATPECYRDFDVEYATNTLIEMSKDESMKKAAANAFAEQLIQEHWIESIEKKELQNLAYRNFFNENWIEEAKGLRDSIILVEKHNPYIQIPMLFFVSNAEGTTLKKEVWINHVLEYLNHIPIAKYELFDYPHNLYKFAYKEMAQTAKEFITNDIHLEDETYNTDEIFQIDKIKHPI